MRQRKVKDLDAKMEAVSKWLVKEPAPEVWGQARDLYLEIGCGKGDFLLQQALRHPENNYIGIEGQPSVVLRAMEKAARIEAGTLEGDDPQWMRDAMAERVSTERRTAMEQIEGAKAAAGESTERLIAPGQTEERRATAGQIANCRCTNNVRFACLFVCEMSELFYPGSLAGVFLNFSDPWPKARHAKRRLTWRGRLQDYAIALQPGGFIAVKTDNDALFEFTLEEIAACGWTPVECTRDLHGPEGEPYEARSVMTEYERKFHEAGKNINYVKVVV